ncbi:DNA polymerase-3 subunit epsilon [Raineyella antarctica]|uniref:DNA polymerase-3 subunit epsilon n=1 Tax=Raineyella antarctica TaxID=1577474 RepID=A0A1G6GGV1_9ACTN|nr:exonuclease domain-containing protein [Raineyella antarctica]SDB80416.1 DNA polymerase-3 subunit epsilon [Raineyella antarctica]
MALDFVAIDFETANGARTSACAVGVAVVENGRLTHRDSWLIRPPGPATRFEPRNIQIHGITAADCRARGIGWPETERRLSTLTRDRIAVAHNATFDQGVWAAANGVTGIGSRTAAFCCSLELARRTVDSPNHKLSTVAQALRLPPFAHHDAGEDALTAARIVLEVARLQGLHALHELWPSGPRPGLPGTGAGVGTGVGTGAGVGAGVGPGPQTGGDRPAMPSRDRGYRREVHRPTSGPSLADPTVPVPTSLRGEVVLITGQFEFAEREEAMARIERAGGRNVKSATRALTLLVIGAGRDARRPPLTGATTKERCVVEKLGQGQRIAVIGEPELRELLAKRTAPDPVVIIPSNVGVQGLPAISTPDTPGAHSAH